MDMASQHCAPNTSESPVFRKGYAWFVVLIASSYFFYEFIQMNMVNSLASNFEQSFHLSLFQLALIACFYYLADTILMYPAGALLDYFSSKVIMTLGVAMCVVGTYLITFASAPWFLVVARFLAGVAGSVCLLSILRLAAEWFPAPKLGFVSGVVVTIGMLGGVVSQQPLVWLIHQTSWRSALHMVGILGVVCLVAILLFVKDAKPQERFASLHSKHVGQREPWWAVLGKIVRNKNNWLVGFYISTLNLPIMLIAALFGSQMLVQAGHVSSMSAAWANTMIFLGTIFGSTVLGYLSDRLQSRRKPMIICGFVSLLLLVLVFIGLQEGAGSNVYIVMFFALGFFSAAQVLGYPVTREVNPGKVVGAALGFVSVLIMLLPTLLQPMVGWLMQVGWTHEYHHGIPVYTLSQYNRLLWVIAVAFVVGIICAIRLPETFCSDEGQGND